MIIVVCLFLTSIIPQTTAMVNGDYNCTYYDQAAQRWRYSPMAVACDNILSDSACKVLYPDRGGYPDADSLHDRPLQCYTTATVTPAAIVDDMKKAAIASCPKNCGLCCQTPAYNCSNVAYPRLNCATITKAQCDSVAWRTIIAQDCPASCGFCNQGGCVDAILDCANDISICNTVGMQDFVNTYCQKTCNRCPSTTTIRSIVASACTSYNADSSTLCAAWALNGFCTNAFYTLAQRKAYCARTCRIC